MAIKEEQYDPGYEDAYGGAYAEGGAKEGQSQVNGQCTFSVGEPSGNVQHVCPLLHRHQRHNFCLLLNTHLYAVVLPHTLHIP